MATNSVAAVRNADLRLLLKVTWPDVKFAVRNGRGGYARVDWVDGPCGHVVRRLLDTVPSATPHTPWGVDLYRSFSRGFMAAACLKARADGVTFYQEREEHGLVLASWTCVWESLDVGDLPQECLRAGGILAEMTPVGSRDDEESGKTMARAACHHGAAVLAAMR